MSAFYLLTILACSLMVSTLGLPAGEDGEWIDDVSNNREVMGLSEGEDFPAAVPNTMVRTSNREDDDGEWVDDVTGNLIVMGEDPLSQARGSSDGMNFERNKRSAGKKMRKAMKKAMKRGKREEQLDEMDSDVDILEGDREKRSAGKKMRKAMKKAMKRG